MSLQCKINNNTKQIENYRNLIRDLELENNKYLQQIKYVKSTNFQLK